MTLTPEKKAAYTQVNHFNAEHPPGTPVLAWPGTRDREPLRTRTGSYAWVLGSGDPVVSVVDYAGGIALTHIEHDPTRQPAIPDIVFQTPPCPMCDSTLDTDGDSFACHACHAYWSLLGTEGEWYDEWYDPTASRCAATARRYATIRPEETIHCVLAVEHDGDHAADGTQWDDTEARALVDGTGQAVR